MKGLETFALKGDLVFSESSKKLVTMPGGYIVCKEGFVEGTYRELPDHFRDIHIIDYGHKLILPGLADIHTHAPQYAFVGLGMDLELIEWLDKNTFPEEAKYKELDYARVAYEIFTEDLKLSATTRACIFGTVHKDSTKLLMDLLEKTGLKCFVGKVNMDRNCPEDIRENRDKSIEDTTAWLEETKNLYMNTMPILTPRFIPSCSDELLKELSSIQKYYRVPLQSHLSENLSEIDWVKELCVDIKSYGEAYNRFDLFGGEVPTIMAHCVYSDDEEVKLMKEKGVFIAHCPDSNTNLSSGIAPVRKYLDMGIPMGLGTDMAAGNTNSIFKTMISAIQVSKLRWRLIDDSFKPLTIPEAFYLGTMGGGAFFGKCGSFIEGYELDAVVINDEAIRHPQPLNLVNRLERAIYLSEDKHIVNKYVAGVSVFSLD
ncbi:MAG: guanine deaminase [Anaerocolumna sp.]|nr:guanine deaminase [Anaerocolumna sp.]